MKSARGFSLIELMVGVVVALVVIGVVMATFLSQQVSMQALDLSREASSAARDAMLSMQETIGRAGYGIDPRYAFDLRNYNCTSYTGATTATNACRDHVNAPDELVFVERDPNYYWAGGPTSTVQGCDDTAAPCTGHAWQVIGFTTVSPYTVTISARAGDNFLVGQVVQITCSQGANPTMGQVKTAVGTAAAGNLTITLLDPVANNPYTANLTAASDPCFSSKGATLFLVNRYRYFVTSMAPLTSGQTANEPWLMLDRGLDYNGNGLTPENGQDPADLIPIAHGVEDLQIAYLLRPDSSGVNAAPDNNTNWVIGDSPGAVEEPNPTLTAPVQNTADNDPLRFNMHPANIRGVRMQMTVRSLRTDRTQGSNWPGDLPGAIPTANLLNASATASPFEDRNDFTAVTLGQFRRFDTAVVVATPNLRSRNPFIF